MVMGTDILPIIPDHPAVNVPVYIKMGMETEKEEQRKTG
jgi:hypothetical protein